VSKGLFHGIDVAGIPLCNKVRAIPFLGSKGKVGSLFQLNQKSRVGCRGLGRKYGQRCSENGVVLQCSPPFGGTKALPAGRDQETFIGSERPKPTVYQEKIYLESRLG